MNPRFLSSSSPTSSPKYDVRMDESLEIKKMQLKMIKYKEKPSIQIPNISRVAKPLQINVAPLSRQKKVIPLKKPPPKIDSDIDHVLKQYNDYDEWDDVRSTPQYVLKTNSS